MASGTFIDILTVLLSLERNVTLLDEMLGKGRSTGLLLEGFYFTLSLERSSAN